MGDFEAIEPHSENPNTQIVTFKDRRTAEKFMFGSKDIPGVGKVELAWVNGPLPSVASSAVKSEHDSDGKMKIEGNGGTGGKTGDNAKVKEEGDGDGDGAKGNGHVIVPEAAADVDYDVAEDDDRWMAS